MKFSVEQLDFGNWVTLIVLPSKTNDPMQEAKELIQKIKNGVNVWNTVTLFNEHTVVSLDSKSATFRIRLIEE